MTSISHGMLSAAIEPTIVQLPLRGMNGAHILVASATDHEHLRRPLKEALVRTAVLNALRSRTDGDLSTLVDVSAGSYGIALARYAGEVGCQARLYVPLPAGEGVIAGIHAARATPVLVDGPVELARDAARAFVERTPGAFFLDQHGSFDLHQQAYQEQARLVADRIGAIDALLAFAGTGGLISVFGEAVRRTCPNARLIRLQPTGHDWAALTTTFRLPHDCEAVDPSDFRVNSVVPFAIHNSPFLARAVSVAAQWRHGLHHDSRILILGTD